MFPTTSLSKPGNVSVHLTNCTAEDAQFISSFLALFTDPKHAPQLADLRAGKLMLQYGPDGDLYWMDISAETPASVAEMLNFLARFTDDEFEQLLRSPKFAQAFRRRELAEAEEMSREILGYKTTAVTLEAVANG
jgi:hypothetical protein